MPYLRTDGDTTIACPECDTAGQVYERTGSEPMHREARTHDADARIVCHECGATGFEPVERPPGVWEPKRDASDARWQAHREEVLAKHGLLEGGE